MSYQHRVPVALTRKRAELAWRQAKLDEELGAVTEELRAIDYSLRLLDPHWVPPVVPRAPLRPARLPHGTVSRACLRLLKHAPLLSSAELAARIVEDHNLAFETSRDREQFTSAITMAMRRHERAGYAVSTGTTGQGGALLWRLAVWKEAELP